jgi:carboxylesterase
MSEIGDYSFFHPGGPEGVLLIHGLSGTPTEMKYVGKGLARAGYTVYGMQLTGHCGTEADLLKTGWHDWAASVDKAYEWLRSRVDTVYAGGLSMGALLSLDLAARNPGACAGLALYSPTLWYDGWNINRFQWLLPLVLKLPFGERFRFNEEFPYGIKDERLRRRVVAQMQSGDSAAAGLPGLCGPSLRELRTLIVKVKAETPSIKTPALILQASEDDITSVKNALFLQNNLAGPRRTVLLDDCYHMITVDRQRDLVVKLTAQYFSEIAAVAPKRAVTAAE